MAFNENALYFHGTFSAFLLHLSIEPSARFELAPPGLQKRWVLFPLSYEGISWLSRDSNPNLTFSTGVFYLLNY